MQRAIHRACSKIRASGSRAAADVAYPRGVLAQTRILALAIGGASLAVALAIACGDGGSAGPALDASPDVVGDEGVAPPDDGPTVDGAPGDAGCAADVRVDPKNCGRCGRDCKGAECKDGVCASELIATALKDPWYLALDDVDIYWTDVNGGSVEHVDKAGKTAPLHLGINQGAPWDVDVDDAAVYWTCSDGGQIVRSPKDGDGGQTTSIWSQPDASALEIALDDAWIYWTIDGAGVFRLPKAGGDASLVAAGAAEGLALDGTRVFWTEHLAKGSVRSDDKAGGAPLVVAGAQNSPSRLAVDDANVYWVSDTIDAIAMAPKGGGAVTVLAQGKEVKIGGIAVDDTWVYWANSGGGTIARVPKSPPHDVEILAEGLTIPVAVAVDDAYVYWTNRDGTLRRVVK
jgi:hypothetical protein